MGNPLSEILSEIILNVKDSIRLINWNCLEFAIYSDDTVVITNWTQNKRRVSFRISLRMKWRPMCLISKVG